MIVHLLSSFAIIVNLGLWKIISRSIIKHNIFNKATELIPEKKLFKNFFTNPELNFEKVHNEQQNKVFPKKNSFILKSVLKLFEVL